MKKNIITGTVVIILGLLIALGPQFLFRVCDHATVSVTDVGDSGDCGGDDGCGCGDPVSSFPQCHWSARAEIGIGFLIAALGACLIVFAETKIQLGLLIGIFFANIIALAVPHTLIGGCDSMTMACRRVAFPALTVEGIILLVFSGIMMGYFAMQKPGVSRVS